MAISSDRTSGKRSASSQIAAVYLDHRTFLKRFISSFLASPDDIDDVVQETYLRAYTAEKEGIQISFPKAFLFQIARNLALKELKKRSRMVTGYIDDVVDTAIITTSLEDQAEKHERLAIFCKAAATLPSQCRRAFLLRKVYGLSHREISQEMNISVSTVEKHLATGLMRCNAYMSARGYAFGKACATGEGNLGNGQGNGASER